jgi:outer membrane protein assembly factor BamB
MIWSSPAVDSGRIYIGTRGSNVYCLNISNGDLLWSYPTDSQTNCSPLVSDGRVYISSDDGKLYCLNSIDGSLMWRYSLSNASINGFSSPAFLNGTIYVGAVINYDSPNVFAIDASNGASKWNYTVDGGTTASPAISDHRVFIGSSNGKVYCLDAINGSQVWNATIGSNWFAGIYMSSPAIADGMLFVGSGDSNCYCLNASNGSQIWKTPTKQMIWSSPAVADGKVYIGSSDGRLYCFNEYTGEQVWSYYTLGRVVSSPAVYGGAVYVGCGTSIPGEGKIYAFGAKYSVPTDLTLSLNSQTSFLGFKVNLNGTLTSNQTVMAGAAVQLSYSINGGQTWNDITSVDTSNDGTYLAVWVPSATGNYLVRASWAGIYPYQPAQVQRTLSVTTVNDQYVFSVVSNSTVSSLAFNSTTDELSFTVAGPSGTTGFVDMGIAKSLVPNVANLKVYLDGTNLDYTATSTADSWFLHFTYSHSTHVLIISLDENTSTPSSSPTPTQTSTPSPATTSTPEGTQSPFDATFLIVVAAVAAAVVTVAVAVVVIKKKRKQ